MRRGYYIEGDAGINYYRTLRAVKFHVSLHTTYRGNPYLNSAVCRCDGDTIVGYIRIHPNGRVWLSKNPY